MLNTLELREIQNLRMAKGFPDGSSGKESICNEGDAGDMGSGWEGGKLQYILAICPSKWLFKQ